MAQADDSTDPAPQEADPRRRRRRRAGFALLGVALAGLLLAWLTREPIADRLVANQLASLDLPATYEVERIAPDAQVLRNVVIGDPARPDLTIARVSVSLRPGWGLQAFGRIVLEQPRLYGRWQNGRVSFGALDKLLYEGKSTGPFRLPDLDIELRDGRARIDSPAGPVGVKLQGAGHLRGGFAGELALIAPQWSQAGCAARGASLYGRLTIAAEKPRFVGPARLGSLDCPDRGLRLAASAMQLDVTADPAFDGLRGSAVLAAGGFAAAGAQTDGAQGRADFAWGKSGLTARYALTARALDHPQLRAATLGASGHLRAPPGLARIETQGELEGERLAPGPALDAALAGLQRDMAGSLAAPLAGQLRTALRRELTGSRLAASYLVRHGDTGPGLVVPQAVLRGGGGDALLTVSRLQAGGGRLTANFGTGGRGLPRIAGRMEGGGAGALSMRLTMADYRAGPARLAVPQLIVAQAPGGGMGFAGAIAMSGPLPGGAARNLMLPLEGNWSPARGLAVGRRCAAVRFDSLSFADLALAGRSVTLCPPTGGAILRADARGLRLAAGAPSLNLAGRLGETPIRLATGPLGFAWPGNLAARRVDVALGPAANPSRFRIASLNARLGANIAGTFSDAQVSLAAVPLDLYETAGDWRFANGRLNIAKAAFRLEDREADDRFQPLRARDASLTLADNRIVADALLREPQSDREVTRVAIVHNLASGVGHADLAIDGIVLDRRLQPVQLSRLALGVIANAEGVVRGTGRIDWAGDRVTSTGRFSTDRFDFAAAFGPVRGVSGTVVFDDLLSLVTAPDQRLKIAAINPGIEVNDGELRFEIRHGNVLAVNGATWPFLDGKLTLEPTRMVLGEAEVRRFTLTIEALDAAKLVERLDMGNINATGTFDGKLPLVFDENGGRIEGGALVARPPGGNVSYVGELTYKDLSAMANFAFDALRSIDYRAMRIDMNGPLEGEIITRVSFEGIRQGATARRNFVTEQVARLPIKFNVNLRAPFFKLVSSVRSLYDPASVTDPRTLGLLDAQGRPLSPAAGVSNPVQPPASGTRP